MSMLEQEGTAELKAFWLEKLHKAEDRYRIAILQTQKALDGYTSMSPSDGNLKLRQALKSQNDATGE